MADNIQITAGTGTVIATDDCGAAGHTQIFKLATSGNGVVTLIPTSLTKGLYVNVAGNDAAPPPHNFGYTQDSKGAFYNTARTGTAVWIPAAGKKIVVQSWQIMCSGATQSDVQLWFGASADTTFTRSTDFAIYDGGYTPSDTGRDNQMASGLWISPAVDHVLRITTTAAVNIRMAVWGYEV